MCKTPKHYSWSFLGSESIYKTLWQFTMFPLLAGPTIEQDRELFQATSNPILSQLRKERSIRRSFRQTDRDKMESDISDLKVRLIQIRRKKWVLEVTSEPEQNGCHVADVIFKFISLNESYCCFIKISLKFVHNSPVDNKSALVEVMDWRQTDDKPLTELNQWWPSLLIGISSLSLPVLTHWPLGDLTAVSD